MQKEQVLTRPNRLCTAHSRICVLPRVEAGLPPQPPRIQRYVVPVLAISRCLTSAGLFEYEEYISLKSINDPNEGYG